MSKQAEKFIDWYKPWDEVLDYDYSQGHIKWFLGGRLNVCYNCVDRHVNKHGDKTAIIWEGNEPGDVRKYTYTELQEQVCRFANVLKQNGIGKGDRVAFIYQ